MAEQDGFIEPEVTEGNSIKKIMKEVREETLGEKKGFPLENILNIDLRDYPTGKEGLYYFKLVGVEATGIMTGKSSPKAVLAKKVPENAEVVVNYTVELSNLNRGDMCWYSVNAVALVPK